MACLTPQPVFSHVLGGYRIELWKLDHFGIRRRGITCWSPPAIAGLILTGRQYLVEWGWWTLVVAW